MMLHRHWWSAAWCNRLSAACGTFSTFAPPSRQMRTNGCSIPALTDEILPVLGRCLQVSGAMMARDSDRPLFEGQNKVITVVEVSDYLRVPAFTAYPHT